MRPLILILIISFPALLVAGPAAPEGAGEDSLSRRLNEVEVSARTDALPMQAMGRGRIRVGTEMLDHLPQILSNADPLRYVQMLPGVQTDNGYDCGLHIYGSEDGQNLVSIEGVPVYNAAHLLGLFSTFNATHYAAISVDKSASDAAFPNRMGGAVTMALPDVGADSTVSGTLSVGLISSQGTLRIPTGRRSLLVASARASYLNLLYGEALQIDGEAFAYSFWDANLTWTCRDDAGNTFRLDLYTGGDHAEVDDGDYLSAMDMRWGNLVAAAHWEHLFRGGGWMRHTFYYTDYDNRFHLDQRAQTFSLPSSIWDIGWKVDARRGVAYGGLDCVWHHVCPQSPDADGTFNVTNNAAHAVTQRVEEYSAHAGLRIPVGRHGLVDAGIRATAYHDDAERTWWSADPSLSFSLARGPWEASLSAFVRHQYLYRTGFSSIGFPTEFWAASGRETPPQHGYGFTLTAGWQPAGGTYRVTAELYYKRLRHQVEYEGTLLDFIYTDYDLADRLLHGSGRNYGAGIMVAKTRGVVTGWVDYGIGRARRTFHGDGIDGIDGTFPATHERIHEMNATVCGHISRRWNVGATCVAASGTPFTAPEYFYVYSGTMVSQYGRHNGSRLAAYFRLDLSSDYKFRTRGKRESGLNFSIYNATARRNRIFWACRVHRDGSFAYRPVSFAVRILPSVGYYIKF